MTVQETGRVIDYIKIAFPMAWKDVDHKKTVAVWADMFADEDVRSVMAAVKAYTATDASGFAPSIGAIKSELVKAKLAGAPTAQDAWNHIRKAISNSGYHAAEEFEQLTAAEQRIVGSPRQLYDWGQMDVETLDSVVASNVQRAYRAIWEAERDRLALPSSVSVRLAELANMTFRRLPGE